MNGGGLGADTSRGHERFIRYDHRMPELPDVEIYVESLIRFTLDQPLERVRVTSPFLLRSFDPPISAVEGQRVLGASRLGKRIVVELEDELFLVLHLMIAGRLRWKKDWPRTLEALEAKKRGE